MARRTKKEALETRNRILDAAEQVFGAKGTSRTSLADIASAADVTRGAIYWHFKNKGDLLGAMAERVTLPMEEMALRAGDDHIEDPLGYIKDCLMNALRQTADDPKCKRVFEILYHKCEYVDEMSLVIDRLMGSRNECVAQIERGIGNAVRKGQLPRHVNTRQAAVGIIALIEGLISTWVLDPALFSLTDDGEEMINTYLFGLEQPISTPPYN